MDDLDGRSCEFCELIDEDAWSFLWVVDAPLFKPTGEAVAEGDVAVGAGAWTAVHHAFTSPQDLVSMIVGKAVKMAKMMNIPVLGIVENYSYLACPDCGKHISVFGESHIDEVAAHYELPVLAKLPIDPKLAAAVDAGKIEDAKLPDELSGALKTVEGLL